MTKTSLLASDKTLTALARSAAVRACKRMSCHLSEDMQSAAVVDILVMIHNGEVDFNKQDKEIYEYLITHAAWRLEDAIRREYRHKQAIKRLRSNRRGQV